MSYNPGSNSPSPVSDTEEILRYLEDVSGEYGLTGEPLSQYSAETNQPLTGQGFETGQQQQQQQQIPPPIQPTAATSQGFTSGQQQQQQQQQIAPPPIQPTAATSQGFTSGQQQQQQQIPPPPIQQTTLQGFETGQQQQIPPPPIQQTTLQGFETGQQQQQQQIPPPIQQTTLQGFETGQQQQIPPPIQQTTTSQGFETGQQQQQQQFSPPIQAATTSQGFTGDQQQTMQMIDVNWPTTPPNLQIPSSSESSQEEESVGTEEQMLSPREQKMRRQRQQMYENAMQEENARQLSLIPKNTYTMYGLLRNLFESANDYERGPPDYLTRQEMEQEYDKLTDRQKELGLRPNQIPFFNRCLNLIDKKWDELSSPNNRQHYENALVLELNKLRGSFHQAVVYKIRQLLRKFELEDRERIEAGGSSPPLSPPERTFELSSPPQTIPLAEYSSSSEEEEISGSFGGDGGGGFGEEESSELPPPIFSPPIQQPSQQQQRQQHPISPPVIGVATPLSKSQATPPGTSVSEMQSYPIPNLQILEGREIPEIEFAMPSEFNPPPNLSGRRLEQARISHAIEQKGIMNQLRTHYDTNFYEPRQEILKQVGIRDIPVESFNNVPTSSLRSYAEIMRDNERMGDLVPEANERKEQIEKIEDEITAQGENIERVFQFLQSPAYQNEISEMYDSSQLRDYIIQNPDIAPLLGLYCTMIALGRRSIRRIAENTGFFDSVDNQQYFPLAQQFKRPKSYYTLQLKTPFDRFEHHSNTAQDTLGNLINAGSVPLDLRRRVTMTAERNENLITRLRKIVNYLSGDPRVVGNVKVFMRLDKGRIPLNELMEIIQVYNTSRNLVLGPVIEKYCQDTKRRREREAKVPGATIRKKRPTPATPKRTPKRPASIPKSRGKKQPVPGAAGRGKKQPPFFPPPSPGWGGEEGGLGPMTPPSPPQQQGALAYMQGSPVPPDRGYWTSPQYQQEWYIFLQDTKEKFDQLPNDVKNLYTQDLSAPYKRFFLEDVINADQFAFELKAEQLNRKRSVTSNRTALTQFARATLQNGLDRIQSVSDTVASNIERVFYPQLASILSQFNVRPEEIQQFFGDMSVFVRQTGEQNEREFETWFNSIMRPASDQAVQFIQDNTTPQIMQQQRDQEWQQLQNVMQSMMQLNNPNTAVINQNGDIVSGIAGMGL